ncbi:MAG: anaerobic magnesium-protoporphyrin IX monomethyl ester cyclase [Parasphingorhabdus sp.]|jgi:anaerobic magnesium-protoporphyrin IX monomethyl ester cyclase
MSQSNRDVVWLDLGNVGDFIKPPGPHEQWQDHGLGLLRTICHQAGIVSRVISLRGLSNWSELTNQLTGADMLLMNVRSYTYPFARKAARQFKSLNPSGRVLVGGMHATVAPQEMIDEESFDVICQGAGEGVIVDLILNPRSTRLVQGKGSLSMDEWPMLDRTLWPSPPVSGTALSDTWPLEPACGWGPPPVATVLTSRVCPWQCSFCNESAFIPHQSRKSVESVIDELNFLDRRYGVGSVVIHDSMFFQNPHWLEQWLELYPRKARKLWPYWAAARSDTVLKWSDLFVELVRETNWNTISIGFESGSNRMLEVLNKECTVEQNIQVIDLVNRLGDSIESRGGLPPIFWANMMLAIPGETQMDAFHTMALVRLMKRVQPSIAYYAPYPGSVLGHQLIAEDKSLMSAEDYHRYPHDEKVVGLDYGFYRDLLNGKYDQNVDDIMTQVFQPMLGDVGKTYRNQPSHKIYLFSLCDGGYKLAYGPDPESAFERLKHRLSTSELVNVLPKQFKRIRQNQLRLYLDQLG